VRILIVDDAALERVLLARIAVRCGHEVAGHAADVAAAVQLATRLAPDLIVLDGRLPPAGALDAIETLRQAAPGASVAVIAGLEELDLVRAARERGAAGALRRPLLASQVAATLAELQPPGSRAIE
jgi:DNA-binding NarL/FixJ family response regulator